MKRNVGETRRRFLAFLSASPFSLVSVRSEAQLRQLTLSSYFLGPTLVVEGGRLFADKVTENSAGTIQVSVETVALTVPFQMISKASALASYYVSEFANIEPVLGLSALPMLTATFDEAEILVRIARPYYSSALARHGQILPDFACDRALAASCAMEHLSHSVKRRPQGRSIRTIITFRRTDGMGTNLHPIRRTQRFIF
jgi:hypothetical protein